MPFSGKYVTISENSHKKHFFFFEPDFVEARNSVLQACNVKQKGVVLS